MPAVVHEKAGLGLKGGVGGFHEAIGRERGEVLKEERIYQRCE